MGNIYYPLIMKKINIIGFKLEEQTLFTVILKYNLNIFMLNDFKKIISLFSNEERSKGYKLLLLVGFNMRTN